MRLWARILVMVAGLMGAMGIVMAAAGSHAGGGELAHLAAEFLLIHAAVVLSLGLSALVDVRPTAIWLIAASILACGVVIFSADLALIAFLNDRPVPIAAPIGGVLMISGWLVLTVGTAFGLRPGQRPSEKTER